jgi:hypothetical protein
MSEDYARAAGSALSLTIDGKEYRVSKFTPRDVGDLQAWLKSEIPDPRVEARKLLEGLPDAVAIEVWRTMAEEAKSWPPTLGDERGNQLLTTSTEGVARLIWVALRKYNGIDLAKARELAGVIELGEVNELVRLASPESADVPKA